MSQESPVDDALSLEELGEVLAEAAGSPVTFSPLPPTYL